MIFLMFETKYLMEKQPSPVTDEVSANIRDKQDNVGYKYSINF